MASNVENPDDYETDAMPQRPRDEVDIDIDEKYEEIRTNFNTKTSSGPTKKIPRNKEFSKSKKTTGPALTANIINISHSNGVHIGDNKVINVINTKDANIAKKKKDIPETKEIKLLMDSKEPLVEKHILFLSSKIGKNWRDVARSLNYIDGQIDQFYENSRHLGIKEVIYQFLLDWKQNEPEKSTQGLLARTLWKCDEKEVVQEWSKHKFE